MANKVIVTKSKLNAIGDAIREKLGETQQYTLNEMTTKIGAITGGNNKGYAIENIIDGSAKFVPNGVALQWTDPSDIMSNNQIIARWGKTIVVRKKDSAPQDVTDGTVVVQSTIKDAYKQTPYIDTTAQIGNFYYYRFFIYTTSDVCTIGTTVLASPEISWSTSSDEEIAAAVAASDIGALDLYKDLGWRVGDERIVQIPLVTDVIDNKSLCPNNSGKGVRAQSITLALMNRGGYNFTNPNYQKRTQNFTIFGGCVYGISCTEAN